MDPLSILGGVGAAAGIVATITKTVKNLSDLQTKYSEAEMSIRQMIRQLMAIKASLRSIQEWTELNLAGSLRERELVDAFDATFEGCKEAMDAMSEEVAVLVRDALAGDKRTMKARYVWNEQSMKDHQDRLDSQVQALQLLLATVQCRTAAEQTALLRDPTNRKIVQKVRDDTSTLRATSSRVSQGRSPSILSHGNSTIGSTEFEMDQDIVNTEAYRRAMAHHQRAKSADARNGRTEGLLNPVTPEQPFRSPSLDGDSGYSEGSEASDHLSPITTRLSQRWTRPRPYERSLASAPANIPHQLRKPYVHITSASDTFLPGLNMSARGKVVEKKRSFLTSIFTGSSSSLSPTSPRDALGFSPGRRRGRRHSDTDIHRSIDLESSEGRSAPPLVQAAQSGSGREVEELLDQRVDIEARHERTRRTSLAVASHCGNDDVVDILLQHGANPNTVDAHGMSPLHLAATRGHYRVVDYLLREQVHVDAYGPGNKTPLRLAADAGHVEVAELLLSRRAKVNARDSKNLTALHAAARLGDEDIVNLLLDHRADMEAKDGSFKAAIHHAAEAGQERIVDMLLSKKADIEALGHESMSPLTSACSAGSTEVVRLLLQRKASLKHKGDGAMTALHWASYNGHSDVVDLLLERKVPIDPRTTDGRTPLHLAVLADNFAVAELLLRRGASVEAQCQNALRPLHYAAMGTNTDLVQLLLGHGAFIEAETRLGKRPLHYATYQGKPSVIDLLLQRRASIDARDGVGDRALCIASAQGHLEAVRLLLDSGAEPRTRYSKGPSHEDSPLCIASKSGHLPIVEELYRRGASVRQRDESNWQPLRYAAYFGHPEIVEFLLACGASISALDAPGTFGFNLTASRIGFAPNVEIDEFRRQSVLTLLNDAEVREHDSQRSAIRRHPTVRAPTQEFVAEKDDDRDAENGSIGRPYERQELSAVELTPRQKPRPYEPRGSNETGARRAPGSPPTNSRSPPFSQRPATPPTVSQASRVTLDPNSSATPRWRPVIPSAPPVPSSASASDRFVSPLPSFTTSDTVSPGIVSPMPPQPYDGQNPRSPTSILRPKRPLPPHPSADEAQGDFERGESGSTEPSSGSYPEYQVYTPGASIQSPPPPTRAAPLPPDLPPIPDPNDAIVVCDRCSSLGRTSTDLTCEGCRRALYMYHHIMTGDGLRPEEISGTRMHNDVYELA